MNLNYAQTGIDCGRQQISSEQTLTLVSSRARMRIAELHSLQHCPIVTREGNKHRLVVLASIAAFRHYEVYERVVNI
jgi:hypothetical protein